MTSTQRPPVSGSQGWQRLVLQGALFKPLMEAAHGQSKAFPIDLRTIAAESTCSWGLLLVPKEKGLAMSDRDSLHGTYRYKAALVFVQQHCWKGLLFLQAQCLYVNSTCQERAGFQRCSRCFPHLSSAVLQHDQTTLDQLISWSANHLVKV
eukprot:1142311-Pelagomonas_calceolata.AAC.3